MKNRTITHSSKINTIIINNQEKSDAFSLIYEFSKFKVKQTNRKNKQFKEQHITLLAECIFSIYDYLNSNYQETNNAFRDISSFLFLANCNLSGFEFKTFDMNVNGKYFPNTKVIGISDRFMELNDNTITKFVHIIIHEFLHAITPYHLNSYFNIQDDKPRLLNSLLTLFFNEKYNLLMEYANEKLTIKIGTSYFNFPLYDNKLYVRKPNRVFIEIRYNSYAIDYKELLVCEDFFNIVFSNDLELGHLSENLNIREIIKCRKLNEWEKYLINFLKNTKKLYSKKDYAKNIINYSRYKHYITAYANMINQYILYMNLSDSRIDKLQSLINNNPLYKQQF